MCSCYSAENTEYELLLIIQGSLKGNPILLKWDYRGNTLEKIIPPMYREKREKKLKIVDFNWAGKAGEVKYLHLLGPCGMINSYSMIWCSSVGSVDTKSQ